jgi:hypothetical protein
LVIVGWLVASALPVDRQLVLLICPRQKCRVGLSGVSANLRLDSSALLIGRLVGYVRGVGGLVGTLIGTFVAGMSVGLSGGP